MSRQSISDERRPPWNEGKPIGQKPPLNLKDVWAIRMRLRIAEVPRDLAPFNLAVDSKLRGCDLVRLRVNDVRQGERVISRAIILQRKTGRPVQFEITPQTRDAIGDWCDAAGLKSGDYLFPSRMANSPHLLTRQYSRLVEK